MARYHNLRTDRVVDALFEYIDTNGLKANDAILPERKLSEQWQVSRSTVRDAINRLCREGIIYTIQGKGNFVAPQKESIDMKDMISFSGAFRSLGKETSSVVIAQEMVKADEMLASHLNIGRGDLVHILTRIREVGTRKLLLEISHIPDSKCPSLDRFQFENASLYHILEIHYGIHMSHQDISVRLSKASREEARVLEINLGDAVFVENATAYTGNNEIVEYTKTIMDAKKAEYSISIEQSQDETN